MQLGIPAYTNNLVEHVNAECFYFHIWFWAKDYKYPQSKIENRLVLGGSGSSAG